MPSAFRAEAPGQPLHVIQHGYCRMVCFFDDVDRAAYLQFLGAGLEVHGCALHAYCLMGNHAHLLLTPSRQGAVSYLLSGLHEDYSRYFRQKKEGREQVLEERFDALPLRSRWHLLSCMQYIELNPVRARLVSRPADYRWSSFRANALGRQDPLLTPHTYYCALGRTMPTRQEAYRLLTENRTSQGTRSRASMRAWAG